MFTNRLKLLIRADAGPDVGTGHVSRMLTLAKAWKKKLGDVALISGDLPKGLMQKILAAGISPYRIKSNQPEAADVKAVLEISEVFGPHWVALAGAPFNDAYQRVVASMESKLLMLDDPCPESFQFADLVLKQNGAFAADILPGKITNSQQRVRRPKFLSGPEFALLQDETSDAQEPGPPRIYSQARRILVSFAGADPEKWTIRTLRVLDGLKRGRMVVDCVVGPHNHQLADLSLFKSQSDLNVRIHRNVDRLNVLKRQADIAIASSTTTCCELVHVGIPTIAVSAFDFQQRIPAWLVRSEIVMTLMLGTDPDSRDQGETTLEQALPALCRQLLDDRDKRKRMSELGRKLFDGKGAERISDEMVNVISGNLKKSA